MILVSLLWSFRAPDRNQHDQYNRICSSLRRIKKTVPTSTKSKRSFNYQTIVYMCDSLCLSVIQYSMATAPTIHLTQWPPVVYGDQASSCLKGVGEEEGFSVLGDRVELFVVYNLYIWSQFENMYDQWACKNFPVKFKLLLKYTHTGYSRLIDLIYWVK